MFRKQQLTFAICLSLAAGAAAGAEPAPAVADASGFYGGVSLRNSGREADGLSFGHLSSVWSRFTLPTIEDAGARTLAYGGYRWANDLSVEAALAAVDRYSLQPALAGSRRGVGLALGNDIDAGGKAWNVDVFTSWEFRKSLSLYGRLGYAQSDPQPTYLPGFVGDVRRNREGVNYGLGLRYDMSPALGLRLEYARFGRLPGESLTTGVLPENDQLQLGVQFRF
jgi:Outer membrane protein beta-barrel domain